MDEVAANLDIRRMLTSKVPFSLVTVLCLSHHVTYGSIRSCCSNLCLKKLNEPECGIIIVCRLTTYHGENEYSC